MKFRFHTGGLKESMATMIEVKNLQELKDAVNGKWQQFNRSVEKLRFDHYGFDSRIGWNTYLVLCKLTGMDNYIPVGMSDNNKFD